MHMIAKLYVRRRDANRIAITDNGRTLCKVLDRYLMTDRDLLQRRNVPHDPIRRVQRHHYGDRCIDCRSGGGNVVIWRKQNGTHGVHSHFDVDSSARAKAFVPASTTPE